MPLETEKKKPLGILQVVGNTSDSLHLSFVVYGLTVNRKCKSPRVFLDGVNGAL